MAKLVCKILSILFVLVSSVVLIRGANVDRNHFLLHLIWGFIGIGFGFFASMNVAKIFCIVSGIFYLLLAVAGFVLSDVGPMHLNFVDDVFHVVLGAGLIAVGVLTKKGIRTAASAPVQG